MERYPLPDALLLRLELAAFSTIFQPSVETQ
jgi:hypothetical protein